MVNTILKNALQNNNDIFNSLADNNPFHELFNKAVDLCINALKKNGTIYVAGNGGSASQADHFAGELVGRFYIDGDSLKVFSLNSLEIMQESKLKRFPQQKMFQNQDPLRIRMKAKILTLHCLNDYNENPLKQIRFF